MAHEIIGRGDDLSVVHAFLDRPVEGLRALVLEGEAGIGKSTIWQASVTAARERSLAVISSRPAETERTLPNLVLGDLFADTAPDLLAALPGPRRRAFESVLLREEPEGPIDPRALGVAIVTLLPELAAGRPLVIAIDDDQWIDPSSAATLRFALRRSLHQPVLLLLSRRFDGLAATPLEEELDPTEVTRLPIGPLSLGAVEALLRRRLERTFPRHTLLRIHEVSGGNPFYALELARARTMQRSGETTTPLAVPPSLDRLVAARLEALDAPTRRALLLIAAHGRMPIALLRALEVEPEAIERAGAAHVLEVARGVVSFTHPLLASSLYQRAAGPERRAAHRRLAAALDDPVQRGRHLALGTDEPDEELAMALESASLVARGRGMAIAAAELAEHALRLTPADAHIWHRRALADARAQLAAGDGIRARAIAADLVTRAAAGPQHAEALVLEAEMEEPGSAVPLLQRALAEANETPALQAVIHANLAEIGRLTKGWTWAERHAEASLELAEGLDDDALRANALSILAVHRFDRGDPNALDLAERACRVAAPLADPRQVNRAVMWVGHILSWSRSQDVARQWLERQLSEWGDRDEQMRSEILWYLALVELWSGRWRLASEYADHQREIGMQYGEASPHHLPPALIALHRGQFAIAREHSERALSLARGQLLPSHIAILAVCDLWRENPTASLANFVHAEGAADDRGLDEPNMRWWRAEYVEALLQLGHVEDAIRLLAEWETSATRLGRERVIAHTLRCRGLLAAARGDLPAAAELLQEAVDQHERAGDPFGRSRAFLALGVVRRRMRQKRNARAALEAAHAGFETLGAASWTSTASAELARIGGRERIEGLSPSELRVAELVAVGRTNREIASALFLSERTVASHLTHIYAKLGVRSRTELARQMLPNAEVSAEVATKVPTS